MDFGDAIKALRNGKFVARTGWNGKNMFLRIRMAADGDKSKTPNFPMRSFIVMKDAEGWEVPWLASQTDMLSTDWVLVRYTGSLEYKSHKWIVSVEQYSKPRKRKLRQRRQRQQPSSSLDRLTSRS